METIYILLPVHNRREVTARFIRCLRSQSYRRWHLVLVDDGSTDGTEEMVRGQVSHLTVLKGAGNWRWAGALQQGYRWLTAQRPLKHDITLIINDDTEFGPAFLARGLPTVIASTTGVAASRKSP